MEQAFGLLISTVPALSRNSRYVEKLKKEAQAFTWAFSFAQIRYVRLFDWVSKKL